MEGDTTGTSQSAAEATKDEPITTATPNEQDNNPFEEYMWMGDPKEEDEVNLQVLEEIIEEEFIESCFEEMLEEEALGLFSPPGEIGAEPGVDLAPPLHALSLQDEEGEETEDGGDGPAVGVTRGNGRERVGAGSAVTPSGFSGHGSDGESEHSDSDSLGDTPQR